MSDNVAEEDPARLRRRREKRVNLSITLLKVAIGLLLALFVLSFAPLGPAFNILVGFAVAALVGSLGVLINS